MKKLCLSLLVTMVFLQMVLAQNVGVGTLSPLMKMHIASTDGNSLMIENKNTLAADTSSAIYFTNNMAGTGNYKYAGAVKSIGGGALFARLGFFTNASQLRDGLLERLTISDGGYVGIGVTAPVAPLEVNGNVQIDGSCVVANNLTVAGNIFANNNNAVIVSNTTIPQKLFRGTIHLSLAGLGAYSYYVSAAANFEGFSDVPTVCIGNVTNGNGGWYQVTITPVNVTNNSCQFVVYNTGPTAVSFSSVGWQVLVTGAR